MDLMKGKTISFGGENTKVTEEEEFSKAMPDDPYIRCDACSLIAQNYAGALLHAETSKGKRPLAESVRDNALEYICKLGLDDYGVYTQMELPDGTKGARYKVPGQFQGPEYELKMEMKSDKWRDRLRSACMTIIEKYSEESEEAFYELYTKHMPAPTKGKHAKGTFAGAEAFARALCEKKDAETAKKTKKKRKTQSSQDVRFSCNASQFFFNEEGFGEVITKSKQDSIKMEL